VAGSTLGSYAKNFRFWESFCNDFGFPVWIDQLPRAEQARMVGLYAGLCASEGHNSKRKGNKYQTFDNKMAAVAFAHKAVRNAKLDYRDPEFELIAQGYKRTHSQVERKQPVTTQMLLQMRQRVIWSNDEDRLLWNSIVLGFFFLDRSSELWGPVTPDKSTGTERAHCVKADNVILRDGQGRHIPTGAPGATSVEFVYDTHKGDRIGQGVVIRHYRSDDPTLCPVAAAEECLSIRAKWTRNGRALGPYLTSISKTKTLKKRAVASAIKEAALSMGLKKEDYSAHSLRIGGACALLAAGKSDLVIRLMGRWSSWCFSVYTRLRPGMVRDAARCMIKASSWDCPEPNLEPSGGTSSEAISER
jgi:hypothetical protein